MSEWDLLRRLMAACLGAIACCFGGIVGAFTIGIAAEMMAGPIGAAIGCISGMALGGILSLFFFLSLPRFDGLLWVIKPVMTPPPVRVLRIGGPVGILEGVVSGVFHGGPAAALVGGTIGFLFGRMMASAAWRLHQHVPIFAMGVVAGVLVEAGGCLLLGNLLRGVAASPALFIVAVVLGVVHLLSVLARLAEAPRNDDYISQ